MKLRNCKIFDYFGSDIKQQFLLLESRFWADWVWYFIPNDIAAIQTFLVIFVHLPVKLILLKCVVALDENFLLFLLPLSSLLFPLLLNFLIEQYIAVIFLLQAQIPAERGHFDAAAVAKNAD